MIRWHVLSALVVAALVLIPSAPAYAVDVTEPEGVVAAAGKRKPVTAYPWNKRMKAARRFARRRAGAIGRGKRAARQAGGEARGVARWLASSMGVV